MFTFGSRLLVSGLLNQIFNNIYYVVIGKLFSPAALGFYTRAKRFQELPSMTLSNIVTRVSFPVFSSVQDDDDRLGRGLRKALCSLVFLNCPVMIGLAVVAGPLVKVLLTEKWMTCVPYLRVLCVLGLLLPLQILNLNILTAKGRSDLFLRLEIIKKLLTVINIAVTYRWGVMAMIWGQVVGSVLSYYLNSYYVARFIQYTAIEQIRDVSPYFVCAGVMGAAVFLLHHIPFASDVILLLAQILCGFMLYALLSAVFRLPAFSESWSLVRRRLPFVHCGAA
jgi:O-antigen/teichoic acid export membrane protein